ncbi:MAG TPA: chemotaxis protein CheB [Polyangiaceae bacterium]|nr:chemotaxis protein CheB [Polyangiaceae bacterium]
MTPKKRILIVDDSSSARLGLRRVLEESGVFEVVGEAVNRAEAVARSGDLRPDLVTMDVHLGGDDGLATTSEIMASSPCPIVIVTALDPARMDLAFRATSVGALDVLCKPSFDDSELSGRGRRRFVAALSALASVKLVGPRGARRARRRERPPQSEPAPPSSLPLVALGASTGGPAVLQRILKALPAPSAAAVVVVQHIEQGFCAGLREFLSTTGHAVEVVTRAMPLAAGHVYLAPDDAHLHLVRPGILAPVDGPPRRFQKPSIDEFFESVPREQAPLTFAALLSGMGDDGAQGLLRLRKAGAGTVAQTPEGCAVPSMPAAALALGAASIALEPEQIARAAFSFVMARVAAQQGGLR